MFGICTLSIVPCRKEPAHRSEMVTQLLFGEHFSILEKKNSWCRIKIAHDAYECWVEQKQITEISEKSFLLLNKTPANFALDLVQIVSAQNPEMLFPIVIGSILPSLKNKDFSIEKNKFSYEGQAKKIIKFSKNSIVENAYLFLNTPYLWGGRSPFGIDCSGFTQIVYRLSGMNLQRDAHQQATQGETLNFVEEAESGDLAFFDNEDGKIIHVGIVLPENKIIHASGKVRVDTLDHYGIFNVAEKKYSHTLRLLKRMD
ncbi:MAG: C40 family peptidase [Bacteroidia bacterium]